MTTREITLVNDVLSDFGLSQSASSDKGDYRNNNLADSVTDWIETQFFIPEKRHEVNPAMNLQPYQRAVIRELHRVDGRGHFVYDLGIIGDIKKSAKSSIAAAIVLYRALSIPWASICIVANDLRQANSRVFYYILRALELNKELGKRATIRNYKITFDNHSTIEAVPVDPSGEAGGNYDLIEWTEAHGISSNAATRMWAEMTVPPNKHGYAQRLLDTYAGHSGESPILEMLYETCVKRGDRIDLSYVDKDGTFQDLSDLEVFVNGSMLCLWNTLPRMPWQTEEYYASESRVLPPNEFLRMHRNEWVSSIDAFTHGEWWDACQAEQLPAFDARTPVVIGMDAGVSNDCFALVGVSRIAETLYVRFCRVWKPPVNGSIDFSEVENAIRTDLTKNYNVVQIAYDAYQLHDMATRLKRDGIAWLYNFPQGQDRLRADKQLYDVIRDRLIIHSGDPILTEHIRNANAQINKEDHTLRIVKRAPHLKIDAAVALSMACEEAKRLNVW